MDPETDLQTSNIGSGKLAKPLPAWPPAYTYTNETCGDYGCRKCWECTSTNSVYTTPSEMPSSRSTDYVWITMSFFRFAEEAQRYLALPPYNKARRGMHLALPTNRVPEIRWRPCAASLLGNEPGGAPEYQLPTLDSLGWRPVPIKEVFQTIPQDSTSPPPSDPESWNFYFKEI